MNYREPPKRRSRPWRAFIITVLISGARTRREIHRAAMEAYTPNVEAQIDRELHDLVGAGEIYRPFKGTYCLLEKSQEMTQ